MSLCAEPTLLTSNIALESRSTGPLLDFVRSTSAPTTAQYIHAGGYELARRIISFREREEVISALERSGLRGRAGGGFPTGRKWWIVARRPETEKYFICNANCGQPGKKERLLLANPHLLVEATAIGAFAVGAKKGLIAVPQQLTGELSALQQAVREAREAGFLGSDAFGSGIACDVEVYVTPGGYLLGEETALMELIEGRKPQPRGKPPLPTAKGLFGAPTVVNNLETLLHAALVLARGPEQFRSLGKSTAPGTMLFSVTGHVRRPGVYELPLGTSLRELLFDYAGGTREGRPVRAVFPGGIGSSVLDETDLDTVLDFDSLKRSGSDLGSGTVIVIEAGASMIEVAIECARFYHESSCGKCQPCKDGTYRTWLMLNSLDRLNEKYIDRQHRPLPDSHRSSPLVVLNNALPAVSYTDHYTGLARIENLCEFYKYRGDCHHSHEAADCIQSIIRKFPKEFEDVIAKPASQVAPVSG